MKGVRAAVKGTERASCELGVLREHRVSLWGPLALRGAWKWVALGVTAANAGEMRPLLGGSKRPRVDAVVGG